MEHDVDEAVGHGVEALGEVAVVGELRIVEPAVQHALVAARDQRGRGAIRVAHVQERRQQASVAVAQREVALVTLHGGDQHLVGKPQVSLGERAAGHAGPFRQVDGLREYVTRVRPRPAQFGGVRIQTLRDEPPTLVLRDDHLLLGEVLLVVLRLVDDDRRAQHAVTLRDVADAQTVEIPFHRPAAELADQPANGSREAQVLGRPGGPLPPAHAARDLQAGDETGHDVGEHVGGVAPPGLDPDHSELRPFDDLAAHICGPGATGAGEALPGLRESAFGVVGDLGLGTAEIVDPRSLPVGHAGDENGDAPRRHQDPEVGGAGFQQTLLLEQLSAQPRRPGAALDLADHRLTDLVRQLFATDLDEEGTHAGTSAAGAASPPAPSRPSPTTSR